jgi:hypothetical protein
MVRACVFRPKLGVRKRGHAVLPMAGRIGGPNPTNSGAGRIFLVRRVASVPVPRAALAEKEKGDA